jgi:hypothetical protein
MAKPDWHYFWLRDLTVLMFIFAGALGAVVAAMWIPMVLSTAAVASGAGQESAFLVLFVLPVCFLVLWAVAWWAAAARRALRMRRLMRTGVSVQATVEKMKVFRHMGGFVSVALWLQYELDGQTYNIKKETSWRGVAAAARDLGRIELAVDPLVPKYAAFVVNGRLG